MQSEIQFILENQNSFTQGNCFERLVRDIIEKHRYEVHSNVHYTGMELDLTAIHKDRKDELLYVECKAKEKVSSSEIMAFEAKVRFKNARFGYFIRTRELDHQAIGLVDELNKDARYGHITFFEPDKVIEILQDSGKIKKVENSTNDITKRILAITHFGDFYILINKDSLGALPSSFYLINAITGLHEIKEETIAILKEKIVEISELELKTPEIIIEKQEILLSEVELHPLIREFCYAKLEQKEVTHTKAADYYISLRATSLNPELEEKIYGHLSTAGKWDEINEIITKSGREFIVQCYLDQLQQMITEVKQHKITDDIFNILEGDIAEIKGNWQYATTFFNNATESKNEKIRIEATIKYGEMLYRLGRTNEAKDIYEEVIKDTENNIEKREWYARVQMPS